MLLDYQRRVLGEFYSILNTDKKSVLEIGGVPPFSVAKTFLGMGANDVNVINLSSDFPERMVEGKVSYQKMDARKMSFADSSFDVIFGVAVLEHISDLETVLDECERVLKPGGCLFLHGGPIWSSCLGHHLYIDYDGIEYRFMDNCPIEPWEHLFHDAQSLVSELRGRGVVSTHAEAISEFVYQSNYLNRYFPEDYMRKFQESKMTMIDYKMAIWRRIDKKTHGRLRRVYPGLLKFEADDISFVMRKKWY